MPATYEPIATTTLSTNTATVTFSSIPSTYTDLILQFAGTAASGDLYIQFNSDNGSNYSVTNLYGSGTVAGSNRASNTNISYVPGNVRNATISGATAHIMNYANTTTNKTVLARAGSSDYEVQARVALWRNTAAITTISLKSTGGDINTGAVITLYGIKAA